MGAPMQGHPYTDPPVGVSMPAHPYRDPPVGASMQALPYKNPPMDPPVGVSMQGPSLHVPTSGGLYAGPILIQTLQWECLCKPILTRTLQGDVYAGPSSSASDPLHLKPPGKGSIS